MKSIILINLIILSILCSHLLNASVPLPDLVVLGQIFDENGRRLTVAQDGDVEVTLKLNGTINQEDPTLLSSLLFTSNEEGTGDIYILRISREAGNISTEPRTTVAGDVLHIFVNGQEAVETISGTVVVTDMLNEFYSLDLHLGSGNSSMAASSSAEPIPALAKSALANSRPVERSFIVEGAGSGINELRGNEVDDGVSSEFSVFSEETSGSVEISIFPQEAVDSGAQWRLINDAAEFDSGYLDSSAELKNLLIGDYLLSFKPIWGWSTPEFRVVTLSEGESRTESAVYTFPTDPIVITPNPLDFGDILVGESRTRSISIFNSSSDVTPLQGIDVLSNGFDSFLGSSSLSGGETIFLPVTFNASDMGQSELTTAVNGEDVRLIGEGIENRNILSIRNYQHSAGDDRDLTVTIDLSSEIDFDEIGFTVNFPSTMVTVMNIGVAEEEIGNISSQRIDNNAGRLTVTIERTDDSISIAAGTGSIVEVDFRLRASAIPGVYPLKLSEVTNSTESSLEPVDLGINHGEIIIE